MTELRLQSTEDILIKEQDKRALHAAYMHSCEIYFNNLTKILKDSHSILPSKNKDISRYLVLNGTEDQVTYYGKPFLSFRLSNHWNWYASYRNCIDPHHIQCFSKDLHLPFKRPMHNHASKPIFACSVGYYGLDKLYHIICGEIFNPITRRMEFIQKDIHEVICDLQEDYMNLWESELEKEAKSA